MPTAKKLAFAPARKLTLTLHAQQAGKTAAAHAFAPGARVIAPATKHAFAPSSGHAAAAPKTRSEPKGGWVDGVWHNRD